MSGRVSMMAGAGMPKCNTCPHLKWASDRHGGWCQHPANRTAPSAGWPTGFTPSVSWDGSCQLHPERAREAGPTLRDLWQAHADATLPIDAPQAEVLRERRQWYGAQLDRLAAMPNRSAADEALFREALGFGRTIGLGLKVTAPNTLLDTLAPGLRDSLYKAVEGQEQLPCVEPATPLLRCKIIETLALASCFEGWTIAIDHGIDESEPITLGGAKVDKFRIVPSEGGSVNISFRVGSNDIDAAEAGLLCSHLGQQISFTLTAPAIKKGEVIDGTVGHPGAASAGQGSLLDDQAQTPEGALAASLEAGDTDPDDDSEGGTTDAGAAEQAELEAGMAQSLTAAGVKPKRGAAKVH